MTPDQLLIVLALGSAQVAEVSPPVIAEQPNIPSFERHGIPDKYPDWYRSNPAQQVDLSKLLNSTTAWQVDDRTSPVKPRVSIVGK